MKKFVIFALIAVAMLCMFVGCDDTKMVVTFHDLENSSTQTKSIAFGRSLSDILAMIDEVAKTPEGQEVAQYIETQLSSAQIDLQGISVQDTITSLISFFNTSATAKATVTVIANYLYLDVEANFLNGVKIDVYYNITEIQKLIPAQPTPAAQG